MSLTQCQPGRDELVKPCTTALDNWWIDDEIYTIPHHVNIGSHLAYFFLNYVFNGLFRFGICSNCIKPIQTMVHTITHWGHTFTMTAWGPWCEARFCFTPLCLALGVFKQFCTRALFGNCVGHPMHNSCKAHSTATLYPQDDADSIHIVWVWQANMGLTLVGPHSYCTAPACKTAWIWRCPPMQCPSGIKPKWVGPMQYPLFNF